MTANQFITENDQSRDNGLFSYMFCRTINKKLWVNNK